MNKLLLCLILTFLGLLSSCTNQASTAKYKVVKTISADSAMVVSAHPLASQIGLEIIEQGGNAIDAAIAVQFALAVTYPVAGNIGGGGFMVYRDNTGKVRTLDYREKAPGLATEKMYQDSLGNVIDGLSTKGRLAVGVPGSVDGMWQAYTKYSKLKDWKKLIAPSILLATEGWPITQMEAERLNYYHKTFNEINNWTTPFNSKPEWKENDLLIQSDLAKTLTAISEKGRDGFYSGWVAEALVAEVKKSNGIISLEDLTNYNSVWRDPISFNYRDYTIYSMPPPSSGGVALAQLFESLEPYDLSTYKAHEAATVHLIVEAERRAYADRATYLGDTDFIHVPIRNLLDSVYIASRMMDFNPLKASKSDSIHAGNFESEETTHFSIVDTEGNSVSITTTLNTSYGSKVVVENAGFFLNNEMDDFSSKPGTPNHYGLVGNEANKIEPNKRMLSSMTPTIIEKDNNLFMVVGTPGGSTIITSVFQTIINVVDFGMTAEEAVNFSRFHHQWLPDAIQLEKDCLKDSTRAKLVEMGHELIDRESIGRVEAIVLEKGKLQGAADIRGDDSVSGY